MQIVITPRDDVLRRYGNALAALGEKKAHAGLARAVNRVTNTIHGRVARAIAKQSSIPVGIVRSSLRKNLVRPGGGGDLEGRIDARGNPLPLKVFNPKQFSWGVRAKVWGRVQRFPHTFIYAGTYRSGQEVGNGHVFHRLSVKSLPIEKLFGPSVPEEMVKDESARVFYETAETMLPARVAHELGRLLP
jgi:hypothetical protein